MPKIFRTSKTGFTQTDVWLDIKRLVENLLKNLQDPEGQVDIMKLRTEINNVLHKARHPVGNPISFARLRRIRELAKAEIEPFVDLIEQESLRPLEVVVIFLCCALFFMQGYVKGEIKQ